MTQPLTSSNLSVQAAAQRDAILYPALFGPNHRSTHALPPEMFTQVFAQPDPEPHWTQGRVSEYAPTDARASWLYVTSGLSNVRDDQEPNPEAPAGLGGEFVLETHERASWAVLRLQYLMAYQLLVSAGRYPDRELLKDYDRLPLGTSIGTEPSALTFLLLAPPVGFPRRQGGRAGWFEFTQAVGISEAEAAAAQVHGGPLLVQALLKEGAFPVTIWERKSLL